MSYEDLHKKVIKVARANKACVAGFKAAVGAESIGQLCTILKENWNDVTYMHREKAAKLFSEYYEEFKDDFQLRDIFYNCDSDRGFVFIYNAVGITVSGTANVSVYGKSSVSGYELACIYATDSSDILLEDYADAVLDGSATCEARGRSTVNAREANHVIANGAVTVNAGGDSTVDARQWLRITACGNASVTALTSRGITMNGTKQLILKSKEA